MCPEWTQFEMVACPGFEPTTIWSCTIASDTARGFPYAMATETTTAVLRDKAAAKRSATLLLDLLSRHMLDANGIAAVSRRWRLALRYSMPSASTAMQYWIEKTVTSANNVQVPELFFNQLKRKENALVLSHGTSVGPKID